MKPIGSFRLWEVCSQRGSWDACLFLPFFHHSHEGGRELCTRSSSSSTHLKAIGLTNHVDGKLKNREPKQTFKNVYCIGPFVSLRRSCQLASGQRHHLLPQTKSIFFLPQICFSFVLLMDPGQAERQSGQRLLTVHTPVS